MQDAIQRAIESGDRDSAGKAIVEIDLRLKSPLDSAKRTELLLNKAVFLGILGRFEDARTELVSVLSMAPNDPEIRLEHDYIHAMLCYQQGDFQEALGQMNELQIHYSEQLNDSKSRFIYSDIQQRRAFALFRLRRFQDAIVVLKKCLTFDLAPKDRAVLLVHLGMSYAELKEREAARDYLLQGCTPNLPEEWAGETHFYLGLTYAHLKLLHESKREFQLCERQLPLPKVYGWLARICGLLGETEESQRYALLARPRS